MSDGKLFVKCKSSEIRAEIERAFKKSKPHGRVKIILKKVLSNIMLNNNEMCNLMEDVIDMMRIDDLDIRKMCCHYLVVFARVKPKEALRALQFFNRFRDDRNPILRALTIKTVSSIGVPEFIDFSYIVVGKLLHDSDAYVRKAAVFSVARLYQHDPKRVLRERLTASVISMLRDSNESIVLAALACLSYLHEQGEGNFTLVLDRATAFKLASDLSRVNEWGQAYILNLLICFTPQVGEDALSLIEAIIPCLQHQNSSVILNSVKAIVYFGNYVKNPELIIPTLSKRLGSSLVSLLSKPPEIQFLVLRNVILLILSRKELVTFDVKTFFCNYNDPIYIKDTKLEIIYLLANEKNVSVVLRELEEYATEIDIAMARKAIRAFGNLAIKIESVSDQCIDIICDLVSNGISYIVREATIVMKNVIRKYPRRYDYVVKEILKHHKCIDEPDAKAALIWLLGYYAKRIDNIDQIFHEFVSNFKEEPLEVQYVILSSVTKIYLQVPDKGEPLVLKVLKWATEEVDNPDVRDRGFMYWRLISHVEADTANGEFQSVTKKVILDSNPIISTENDSIDPAILEELDLNIGTLASIYLKPVQTVFRFARKKTLAESPALQSHSIPSTATTASTDNFSIPKLSSTYPVSDYESPKIPDDSQKFYDHNHASLIHDIDSALEKEPAKMGSTKDKLVKKISSAALLGRKNKH